MKSLVAAATATVFAGSVLAGNNYYGGDFDGRNGGASQQDGGVFSAIYEEVTLNSATNITSVLNNSLMQTVNGGNQISLWWEVRQGISEGNGGVVIIAGHFSNVTSQATTGRAGFGLTEWTHTADVTAEGWQLGAGTYFLAVALGPNSGGGAGNYGFLSVTSGANGVGAPLANGNSFWNSSTFGLNWTESANVYGPGTWDHSLGLGGTPVPAPGAIALLGLAGLASRKRRRN